MVFLQKNEVVSRSKQFGVIPMKTFFMFVPFMFLLAMNISFAYLPFLLNLFLFPFLIRNFIANLRTSANYFHVDPSSISIAFSVLFLIYSTLFFRVLPNSYKKFPITIVILSISSFCLFYFYHISITRDPGILQTPSLEPEELVTKNSIYSKYDSVFLEDKFCETCRIFRPLRSKHDSTTNRCIARFDHFCPWTINGVGHNNHTYFYYFLVSVVVSCGIFTFIVLDTLVQNNKTESFSFSNLFLFFYNCYLNDSWLLAIWILNNLILGWVIALWLQHSWFIIQNITTNEMLNRRRYSHFLKNSRFHNPFSLGSAYRNSLQFFKINYLVDWYNVFWFDNLRFGDHQHLQVLNQKII
eukprot:Anaeramoba_ignava/a611737_17.p1 GENE.a611737_17~~a611737_17.p1  ORF type:complete len:355 (+),score=47.31 a611737_17:581-1645(+)